MNSPKVSSVDGIVCPQEYRTAAEPSKSELRTVVRKLVVHGWHG